MMTWGQLVFEGFKQLIHILPYMLYIFGIRVQVSWLMMVWSQLSGIGGGF